MNSIKKSSAKLSVVAKKYASALVDSSSTDLESALSELKVFNKIVNQNPDLSNYFNDSSIAVKTKLSAVESSLKKMSSVSAGFIACLIENKRFSKLDEVLMAVQFILDEKKGVKRGTVQSAAELSEIEKVAIKEKVKNFLKANVELEYETNENLLGGAKVNIAGWTIDDSLKNQLNKLKENLNRSAN